MELGCAVGAGSAAGVMGGMGLETGFGRYPAVALTWERFTVPAVAGGVRRGPGVAVGAMAVSSTTSGCTAVGRPWTDEDSAPGSLAEGAAELQPPRAAAKQAIRLSARLKDNSLNILLHSRSKVMETGYFSTCSPSGREPSIADERNPDWAKVACEYLAKHRPAIPVARHPRISRSVQS